MQLVDEEDHVSGALDVPQHGFDALLEVAAVLGAREHGGDIQRDDALAAQRLRRVPARDAQRQPLGHGGLAHAGLAHEDGIILAAAGEDLHGAADLIAAADHRVDAPGGGELRQVPAVLVQHPRLGPAQRARQARLRPLVGRGGAEHVHDVGVEIVGLQSQLPQQRRAAAVRLTQDAEEQVLGPDEALTQQGGLRRGALHRLPGVIAQALLRPRRTAPPQPLGEAAPQSVALQPVAPEDRTAQTLTLGQHAQQQMLRADEAVSQLPGDAPGLLDGLLGPYGKLLVALHPLPPSAALSDDHAYHSAVPSPKTANPRCARKHYCHKWNALEKRGKNKR